MESLQDLFTSLLNIILCLSPFVFLGLLVFGAVFFASHRKKQRAERLRGSIKELSALAHTGVSSVAQVETIDDCPFAKTLMDGARLLGLVSQGDIAPLEQKRMHVLVQALQAYRQRASYGSLPIGELTQERQAELSRVDRLAGALTRLWQQAEEGNSNEVARLFREVDGAIAETYSRHIDFHRQLSAGGVEFPIPQPAPTTTTLPSPSADQVTALVMQKLPQEKQMLFLMQYNGVKKNPTTAVLLAVFLGGLGVHRFYMGDVGWGVLYLLFSWTWIPLIVALLEAFFISGRVHRYNAQKAAEIANTLMLTSG